MSGYLAAMESGELRIPENIHDREGWNKYWRLQAQFGGIEQGFNDMMSSDEGLVPLLTARAVRAVLCVGPGLSMEPLSLSLHGFDVTALDISDVPRDWFHRTFIPAPDSARMQGVTIKDGDTIVFPPEIELNLEACPAIHRSSAPHRGGGSLRYITGDLIDGRLASGPFDALIERRTVQLFKPSDRHAALDCLAARLAPRAFLLSHEHRGVWTPDQPRLHFGADWLRTTDFVDDWSSSTDAPRIARLYLSTG